MYLKALRAERLKLKHSPVWIAFLVLPVLPAIMGTFNYLQNVSILQDEWYSLWTQHTLFTCYFFLPAIIGVYCSYLCRLEHTHHNWNMVMTAPVSVGEIYFAKLTAAAGMVLLTEIWTGILFLISGKLCGLTSTIPDTLSVWLFCGFIGGMVICAIQLLLSLVLRSFAVPVGIALIGGVLGLAAFAKGLGAWFPYTLLALGMRANAPGGPIQGGLTQFLLHSIVFFLIFVIAAMVLLKKRDVVTG